MSIFEGLVVGQTATVTRAITDADVALFALITGDHHPLHLDAHYAQSTHYGQRIVPAALISGVIEAALAENLPGRQGMVRCKRLEFLTPMAVDETLTVIITLLSLAPDEGRAHCAVVATQSDGAEVARGNVDLHIEDLPPFNDEQSSL